MLLLPLRWLGPKATPTKVSFQGSVNNTKLFPKPGPSQSNTCTQLATPQPRDLCLVLYDSFAPSQLVISKSQRHLSPEPAVEKSGKGERGLHRCVWTAVALFPHTGTKLLWPESNKQSWQLVCYSKVAGYNGAKICQG